MAIKNCIGIANAIGFGSKAKNIPKVSIPFCFDNGDSILFDNNDVVSVLVPSVGKETVYLLYDNKDNILYDNNDAVIAKRKI